LKCPFGTFTDLIDLGLSTSQTACPSDLYGDINLDSKCKYKSSQFNKTLVDMRFLECRGKQACEMNLDLSDLGQGCRDEVQRRWNT
jgi:hypothetical protein